eukprot:gene915-5215_t
MLQKIAKKSANVTKGSDIRQSLKLQLERILRDLHPPSPRPSNCIASTPNVMAKVGLIALLIVALAFEQAFCHEFSLSGISRSTERRYVGNALWVLTSLELANPTNAKLALPEPMPTTQDQASARRAPRVPTAPERQIRARPAQLMRRSSNAFEDVFFSMGITLAGALDSVNAVSMRRIVRNHILPNFDILSVGEEEVKVPTSSYSDAYMTISQPTEGNYIFDQEAKSSLVSEDARYTIVILESVLLPPVPPELRITSYVNMRTFPSRYVPRGCFDPDAGLDCCLPGFVGLVNEGQAPCSPCEVGSYAREVGLSECKLCSGSSYSSASGAALCTTCPDGTTANDSEGSTGCTECEAGSYGTSGSCRPCKTGSYSKTPGVDKCTDCPVGTIASSTGLTKCTACAPGEYARPGGQTCSACSSGSYESGGVCEDCPAGSIASGSGATECTECEAGSYASRGGSCSACSRGTFSAKAGSPECTDCPVGTIASSTGSTKCTACAPGEYARPGGNTCSSYESGGVCEDCPAGSIASGSGATECTECEAGSYASRGRSCYSCSRGTFSANPGSSECTRCPSGTTSDSGATSCK